MSSLSVSSLFGYSENSPVLKKAVASSEPKNITELEAIAREEWAKIHQKCCQKLVSCSTSYLQLQVITVKGVLRNTKDAIHEGVESF